MSVPAAMSVPDEVEASPLEPMSVLIVDDMSTLRYMLSQYVRQQGHRAEQASNGLQALELLRSEPYDLVLLDVMMPEMDGHAVLAELKSDPRLREIPVIVISGVEDLESVVRCIEGGAEDYLYKPVNPTLLRARVNACLRQKRWRDEELRLQSQLRKNYERLQELEKLRDSLTHMVVHDLRTPLTSLLTGLYTLEMMGDLNDEQREFWQMGVTGAEQLLGMINDLLDISKMEDGSMQLAFSNPTPQGLIDRALQQVAELVREKELTVEQVVADRFPILTLDEDKIRRVLVNLLGNAVKFTPRGGRITVQALPDGQQGVRFSVIDTGEGIPQEAFGKIFEKFGQVEDRQAGRKNSTGLGLTFCKMAVEAHGGSIWVESELGCGSTFSLTVPVSPGAC